MTTVADVLAEIKRQLEWESPSGAQQGHIVLKREMAEHLERVVLDVIMERDNLVAELERLNRVIESYEKDRLSNLGGIGSPA
jgi:hypothetical protein